MSCPQLCDNAVVKGFFLFKFRHKNDHVWYKIMAWLKSQDDLGHGEKKPMLTIVRNVYT